MNTTSTFIIKSPRRVRPTQLNLTRSNPFRVKLPYDLSVSSAHCIRAPFLMVT